LISFFRRTASAVAGKALLFALPAASHCPE